MTMKEGLPFYVTLKLSKSPCHICGEKLEKFMKYYGVNLRIKVIRLYEGGLGPIVNSWALLSLINHGAHVKHWNIVHNSAKEPRTATKTKLGQIHELRNITKDMLGRMLEQDHGDIDENKTKRVLDDLYAYIKASHARLYEEAKADINKYKFYFNQPSEPSGETGKKQKLEPAPVLAQLKKPEQEEQRQRILDRNSMDGLKGLIGKGDVFDAKGYAGLKGKAALIATSEDRGPMKEVLKGIGQMTDKQIDDELESYRNSNANIVNWRF
jgi:hypothetical protein